MKKQILIAFVLLLGSTCLLHAGANEIIKQRAKDLRDENNARQGVPPRTPPPSQTPAQATPPAALPPSPGQQSMAKFQATLGSIQRGSTLDDALKQKLVDQLLGMAEGTKPSKATAERFVTGLHKAISAKPLLPANRAKLGQDLNALFNPGKYPQAKPEGILEDIRTILLSSGASTAEATDLTSTVRLMVAEVKK